MAEKSTILPKKLISLNKTFNTATKAKEQKQAKREGTEIGASSFDSSSSATAESVDSPASRKTSLFSSSSNGKAADGKADGKLRCFVSKSVDIGRPSDSKSVGGPEAKSAAASNKKSKDVRKSKAKSTESDESDKSQLISKLSSLSKSSGSKSAGKASAFKYSFFTSTNANTATKASVLSTSAGAADVKPTSALSTIHSTSSSLSNSPKSTPAKSGSLKSKSKSISSASPATNQSLPKFKLTSGKKKAASFEPQWHADSQIAAKGGNNLLISKNKLKEKPSKSNSLRSRTARTINTFVKPIKRPSIRFENKKFSFSSAAKPRIEIEHPAESTPGGQLTSPSDDPRYTPSTSPGLKVSFDEDLKIDRHRSNSDNSSRLKKTLISSLRRSIFANPELGQSGCSSDRSLSIPNKSLSNRMISMISKGKSHLAIVRSHSLESNKFSAKRKNQQISKSQSKLIPLHSQSSYEPPFDEYKFQFLKWSITNDKLDENLVFINFFKFYRCYDLIPTSSKLVVFDTQLLVKKAFSGLVTHGIKAAPLWSCKGQCYVGMLTISYFINILIDQYENCNLESTHFEEQKLDAWKDYYTLSDQFCDSNFISIDPDANVYDAIGLLIKHKIHRLPVLDPLTQNVIYVLTHKRILRFLYIYYAFLPKANFLKKSIHELKIGTYSNIETVTPQSVLLNALNKFIKNNISSLPIVDSDGKLLDVFCKFDLFNLAANKMYSNLDISIKKALEQRVDSNCELLVTCFAHTSLHNVIELFVSHEAHRLIIIDENDKVVGIICLSDVLAFLISEHKGELQEDEQGDAMSGRERGPLQRSVSSKVTTSDKVLERINELSEQKRPREERRPGEERRSGEERRPRGDSAPIRATRTELDRRKVSGGDQVGGRQSSGEGSKAVSNRAPQVESRSSDELCKKSSSDSTEQSKASSRELSREPSKASSRELSREPSKASSKELSREQSKESSSRQLSEEQSSESDSKPDENSNEDKNGEEFTV